MAESNLGMLFICIFVLIWMQLDIAVGLPIRPSREGGRTRLLAIGSARDLKEIQPIKVTVVSQPQRQVTVPAITPEIRADRIIVVPAPSSKVGTISQGMPADKQASVPAPSGVMKQQATSSAGQSPLFQTVYTMPAPQTSVVYPMVPSPGVMMPAPAMGGYPSGVIMQAPPVIQAPAMPQPAYVPRPRPVQTAPRPLPPAPNYVPVPVPAPVVYVPVPAPAPSVVPPPPPSAPAPQPNMMPGLMPAPAPFPMPGAFPMSPMLDPMSDPLSYPDTPRIMPGENYSPAPDGLAGLDEDDPDAPDELDDAPPLFRRPPKRGQRGHRGRYRRHRHKASAHSWVTPAGEYFPEKAAEKVPLMPPMNSSPQWASSMNPAQWRMPGAANGWQGQMPGAANRWQGQMPGAANRWQGQVTGATNGINPFQQMPFAGAFQGDGGEGFGKGGGGMIRRPHFSGFPARASRPKMEGVVEKTPQTAHVRDSAAIRKRPPEPGVHVTDDLWVPKNDEPSTATVSNPLTSEETQSINEAENIMQLPPLAENKSVDPMHAEALTSVEEGEIQYYKRTYNEGEWTRLTPNPPPSAENVESGVDNLCINNQLVPQLFVLGPMVTGSTSLCAKLRRSTSLVWPRMHDGDSEQLFQNRIYKEPHFFDTMKSKSVMPSKYGTCQTNTRKIGVDGTARYSIDPYVPGLMSNFYGNQKLKLKFLVLLREPLARLQSHFYHSRFYNWCPELATKNFAEICDAILRGDDTRYLGGSSNPLGAGCGDFVEGSMYTHHLTRWLKEFLPGQFTALPFRYNTEPGTYGRPGNKDMVTYLWKQLGVQGADPGEMVANQVEHPALWDDLDPLKIAEMEMYFEPKTGSRVLAQLLLTTGVNMYGYQGMALDAEKVAAWIRQNW